MLHAISTAFFAIGFWQTLNYLSYAKKEAPHFVWVKRTQFDAVSGLALFVIVFVLDRII